MESKCKGSIFFLHYQAKHHFTFLVFQKTAFFSCCCCHCSSRRCHSTAATLFFFRSRLLSAPVGRCCLSASAFCLPFLSFFNTLSTLTNNPHKETSKTISSERKNNQQRLNFLSAMIVFAVSTTHFSAPQPTASQHSVDARDLPSKAISYSSIREERRSKRSRRSSSFLRSSPHTLYNISLRRGWRSQ